ncbi:hypothetical protein AAG570_013763 [Ranatra chinensis]|uniref:Uncharacterized protein n=1 Tax=Ranatra chinensis TaxID=642074 RepID=A0ABD0YDU1_9HEMI
MTMVRCKHEHIVARERRILSLQRVECLAYVSAKTLMKHLDSDHRDLVRLETQMSRNVVLDIADILMYLKWSNRIWISLLVVNKEDGDRVPVILNITSSTQDDSSGQNNTLFPKVYYLWLSAFIRVPLHYAFTIKAPKKKVFWGFRSTVKSLCLPVVNANLDKDPEVMCLQSHVCKFNYTSSNGIQLAIAIQENWDDKWKRDITDETFMPAFL